MSKKSDSAFKSFGPVLDALDERFEYLDGRRRKTNYDPNNIDPDDAYDGFNPHGDGWSPTVSLGELGAMIAFAKAHPKFGPEHVGYLEGLRDEAQNVRSREIPGLWFRSIYETMAEAVRPDTPKEG